MDRTVLMFFGACDPAVSDQQIFDVLRSAEEGVSSIAELCAANDISIPMYCVWKAKYRALTLDDVRAVRRRSAWRARVLCAGAVAVLVGVAGGGVRVLARPDVPTHVALSDDAEDSRPAPAATILMAQSATADQPAARVVPSPEGELGAPMAVRPSAPSSEPAVAPRVEPPAQRALETTIRSADQSPSPPGPAGPGQPGTPQTPARDEGYAVQVVAAPTRQLAETSVETLMAAGYPAYMLPIVVDGVEHFRVRVGPFQSRPDADVAAVSLKRAGHPAAWVTR